MPPFDPSAAAREILAAHARRQPLTTFSSRYPDFDLASAYEVERELVAMRKADGHATVGRKVGYANKALWRALKLETLVWAPMYDDTVSRAKDGWASLSLPQRFPSKIEPEIVFKLKSAPSGSEPADALAAVEWIALGFEIIDCPFPDWKYQPTDFVAAAGLHVALVIGETRPVDAASIPTLVDQLARFTVKLSQDGRVVQEGGGRNVLRSPALCLAELSAAANRQGNEPLRASEIISSGSLTESTPFGRGETWSVAAEGLDLPPLTLTV
jgi:2-oxo-3-hexenedioate decarboxylase